MRWYNIKWIIFYVISYIFSIYNARVINNEVFQFKKTNRSWVVSIYWLLPQYVSSKYIFLVNNILILPSYRHPAEVTDIHNTYTTIYCDILYSMRFTTRSNVVFTCRKKTNIVTLLDVKVIDVIYGKKPIYNTTSHYSLVVKLYVEFLKRNS